MNFLLLIDLLALLSLKNQFLLPGPALLVEETRENHQPVASH
jgi:hypothetical protein